jgi:hypothetical protein
LWLTELTERPNLPATSERRHKIGAHEFVVVPMRCDTN